MTKRLKRRRPDYSKWIWDTVAGKWRYRLLLEHINPAMVMEKDVTDEAQIIKQKLLEDIK